MNTNGDTSSDSISVSAGGSGPVFLVNSGNDAVTPEVAYGLVLKHVGKDAVNLMVAVSLVATTSCYAN